ncbi:polysaccharide deacetylase family protein [Peristeroidobacter soli]|uniref:polysaccharide deacetylase family protein n=1 Tax=Peristeroidobacter soli TaxID=2497877 RepID=UPI00101D59BE|nr:polysaccharide deacetylase family protein [Peristeroidobacter soli]
MTERIALKVDVDTLRGTLEGVPPLVELLKHYRVNATFLFSLGPDNTGRALRRIFRPGFLGKVLRTSVAANYGLKTLCYGVLLPAPNISERAADVMRAVRDAGFEVGVHCNDHVLWQDHVAAQSHAWTREQMQLAVAAFQRVFGERPKVHGAAGWQMNEHVPQLEAELGFEYASDTRGRSPFRPMFAGAAALCPQLPTTLPTFDEIIGLAGCTERNVADVLFEHSRTHPGPHVFTLHAELEGMRLRPAFERLLQLWIEHGLQPCSMRELYLNLPPELPSHPVEFGELAGRSGLLACQFATPREHRG